MCTITFAAWQSKAKHPNRSNLLGLFFLSLLFPASISSSSPLPPVHSLRNRSFRNGMAGDGKSKRRRRRRSGYSPYPPHSLPPSVRPPFPTLRTVQYSVQPSSPAPSNSRPFCFVLCPCLLCTYFGFFYVVVVFVHEVQRLRRFSLSYTVAGFGHSFLSLHSIHSMRKYVPYSNVGIRSNRACVRL